MNNSPEWKRYPDNTPPGHIPLWVTANCGNGPIVAQVEYHSATKTFYDDFGPFDYKVVAYIVLPGPCEELPNEQPA